jgi:hypothetical protein
MNLQAIILKHADKKTWNTHIWRVAVYCYMTRAYTVEADVCTLQYTWRALQTDMTTQAKSYQDCYVVFLNISKMQDLTSVLHLTRH